MHTKYQIYIVLSFCDFNSRILWPLKLLCEFDVYQVQYSSLLQGKLLLLNLQYHKNVYHKFFAIHKPAVNLLPGYKHAMTSWLLSAEHEIRFKKC